MTTTAAPGFPDSGTVLNTKQSKAEAKAEAEAKKEQAKAEAAARKQQKICKRDGTLRCDPTVIVTFETVVEGLCRAIVTVRGFSPGYHLVYGSFSGEHERSVEVLDDGTGSITIFGQFEGGEPATIA